MKRKRIEYAVDYNAIDPVKKYFQAQGLVTARRWENLRAGQPERFSELDGCRGESAHIIETPWGYIGCTIEGLGTRNKIAEEVFRATGVSHFHSIGVSSVAVITNDLSASGIRPVACFMHLAAGSNEMFKEERMIKDFGRGWASACIAISAICGGGETPMLRDIIFPDSFEISGAAWGWLPKPKCPVHSGSICAGDVILGAESSGIHDNGLTLCRDIRKQLQEGYATPILGTLTFGEALLQPTVLYTSLVNALMDAGIEICAIVNITGHGWAKLARAVAPFHYKINFLPPPHAVFGFIQKRAGLSNAEMYHKFNMGMGYALILPRREAKKALAIAAQEDYGTWICGEVEKSPDSKKRVLLPNGVTFTEKDVAVR